MTKLRLGLLGCGLAARHLHWPALRRLRDQIEVVAVSNRTRSKAEALASTIQTEGDQDAPRVYEDFREAVADPGVDAVAVLLPLDLNEDAVRAASAAGKHVLLEKPLSTDLASGKRILDIESAHPELVFMLAENFRFRRVFRELKALLAAGRIGKPIFASWKTWQLVDENQTMWAQTAWRTQHSFDGGFITDAGVHNIAAFRDLFGQIQKRGSTVGQLNPAIGRTDTMAYLFETSGTDNIPPITCLFHTCFSTAAGRNELEVLGTSGSLRVEDTKIFLDDAVLDYPDDGGYLAQWEAFAALVRDAVSKSPKERDKSLMRSSLSEGYEDLKAILSGVNP